MKPSNPPSLAPPEAGKRDKLGELTRLIRAHKGRTDLTRAGGRVIQATPTRARITGIHNDAKPGGLVEVANKGYGEVVEVTAQHTVIRLSDPIGTVGLNTEVWVSGEPHLRPHDSWCGRVIDPFGNPLDGLGSLQPGPDTVPVDGIPNAPMDLGRVVEPIRTGVRVVDLFTPLCAGQRIGVFAGSGVGKTTMLSMMMRTGDFDVVVLALVGERGREVREFLEDVIGDQLPRTITVVSSSADDAIVRKMCAKAAMAIAESFRNRNQRVLLVIDSITRFIHAARELALAAGEAPVARGYTPSVLSEIPLLLERAGPGREGSGSITALISVLVDGDDTNEPVADTVRGILDGHIVLDRGIAAGGRFPAVDVLTSISRLCSAVLDPGSGQADQTHEIPHCAIRGQPRPDQRRCNQAGR